MQELTTIEKIENKIALITVAVGTYFLIMFIYYHYLPLVALAGYVMGMATIMYNTAPKQSIISALAIIWLSLFAFWSFHFPHFTKYLIAMAFYNCVYSLIAIKELKR